MKIKFKYIALITAILFISCGSQPKNAPQDIEDCFNVSQLVPETIEWKKLETGFEYFSHKVKALKVTWHVIKIDLETPFLQIHMYPDSESIEIIDFEKYALENNVVTAFNTTPFTKVKNNISLMGVQINNNKLLSKPESRLFALYLQQNPLTSKIKAQIVSQKDLPSNENPLIPVYVIGGYFQMINDGQILEYKNIPHSNLACGLSEDGRFLYIFAAIPDFSPSDENGLYYKECSLILQKLGCYNAISFDGGKSTQLYVKGKGYFAPALKRKVPACLGFSISNHK